MLSNGTNYVRRDALIRPAIKNLSWFILPYHCPGFIEISLQYGKKSKCWEKVNACHGLIGEDSEDLGFVI